jgi:protein-tyrosine phosphatase
VTEDGAGESTSRPFEILVVCTANQCRSPLAEQLFRAELAPPSFQVASAGVRALDGAEMEPLAAAELRRLGGDPETFRSRQLHASYVESADLVLTATRDLRAEVLAAQPHALRRTFTLLEFADLVSEVPSVRAARGRPVELVRAASDARGSSTRSSLDVDDPVGRPPHVHRQVADVTAAAVHAIAAALQQADADGR